MPVADWEGVIALANKTLVTPTLAERIAAAPGSFAVPGDVRTFLAAIHARNRERNRRLFAQLSQAVGCLNSVGVEPILIKGAAMLTDAGEDAFGGRILSDLDLLVPPLKVGDCVEALAGIGYAIDTLPTNKRLPMVLSRSRDVGMIDLHNRLRIESIGGDYAGLSRYCRPQPLGASRALLPSPTFRAMILVLHDQLQDRDYWRGLIDLRHLVDLVRISRLPGGIDWTLLASLFAPGNPRTALRTQLLTARNLLGLAVPPELVAGLRPRLQYRRRLLQSARPGLMRVLTTLTLLTDYPRFPHEPPLDDISAASPPGTAWHPSTVWRKRGYWRFFQPPAPGKA